MTDAASRSPCLVDPVRLWESARGGYVSGLVDGGRIALSAAAHRSLDTEVEGASCPELLSGIHDGRIAVLSATAVEIGGLTSREYRERLSLGEIEALALVRSRWLGYCTEQRVVIGVMEELRLVGRLVPVTTLTVRSSSWSRRTKVRGRV